jgi:hypothetical protein
MLSTAGVDYVNDCYQRRKKNAENYGQKLIYVVIKLRVLSGFCGVEVACWSLVPTFAGSTSAEAVGFFREKKNPEHAFLRGGSKAVLSHVADFRHVQKSKK